MSDPTALSPDEAESTWALISDVGRAHRVQPAGGEGYWRAGCGRIVRREPMPVEAGHPRCNRCEVQLDGSQAGRPVIHGARRA